MISAILLSGGLGKRMRAEKPKQYLPLHGKPVILHALEALLSFPFWSEIVIVCEKENQSLFDLYQNRVNLRFALPGKERQDSVLSGLNAFSSKEPTWVCIHDGARPLLLEKDLLAVIAEGKKTGAAALAVPVKMTLKEVDNSMIVKKTLDRSCLWEIQTPQVLNYTLLKQGHQKALMEHFITTDDVSLVEALGHAVHLVSGSDSNLKITTSIDLLLAEILLKRLHG